MKTTALFLSAFAACSLTIFAQAPSQTGGGGQPGVDKHPGYDTDGDGKLSDKETEAMDKEMKALAMMHHKMMVKKYDKDGDGKLSDDETAAMEKDRDAKMKSRHEKMIATWDKDKDGKLSDEEKAAMHKQRVENRKTVLGKYDANKDGVLDDTEIETAGKADDSMLDDMVETGPRSKR